MKYLHTIIIVLSIVCFVAAIVLASQKDQISNGNMSIANHCDVGVTVLAVISALGLLYSAFWIFKKEDSLSSNKVLQLLAGGSGVGQKSMNLGGGGKSMRL